MSEKKEAVLSLDDLEKSWSDSKTLLKSILDDENTEVLSKAKKEAAEDDVEADFDDEMEDGAEEEEEEEVEEEAKAKIKKSLSDDMDDDEESSAAMDVEPFLRKMVKSMSGKFAKMEEENKKLSTMLAKSLMVIGEQNLTIAHQVQELSESPVTSRSVIRKSIDKFPANTESKNELLKSMTVDQVLEKAVSLSKSGKLTSLDVAKIQNRLNKGVELNPEYVAILTKEEK